MSAAPAAPPRKVGWTAPKVPLLLIYAVGFIPAIYYIALAFADELGADPAKTLEHALGLWALRFLVAGLALTPLRQAFKINLLRYRRQIGLLAFYYVGLHLMAYVLFDRGPDLAAIWQDILRRPYITIGMAAFVILIPLAATSNNASIRALGGKAWAKLHKLVYLAAVLGALHFVMVLKGWQIEPLVYAAIVLALLAYRAAKALRPRIESARA